MARELGSFADNAAILAVASRALQAGATHEALPVLRDLRERMADAKSRRWLLPEVERLIGVAEAVPKRRRDVKRRRRPAGRTPHVESLLVRLAAIASLITTIIRLIVSEVSTVFTHRG